MYVYRRQVPALLINTINNAKFDKLAFNQLAICITNMQTLFFPLLYKLNEYIAHNCLSLSHLFLNRSVHKHPLHKLFWVVVMRVIQHYIWRIRSAHNVLKMYKERRYKYVCAVHNLSQKSSTIQPHSDQFH